MKKVGRWEYKKIESGGSIFTEHYQRSKREERRYQAKLERAARKKQFKARRKHERKTSKA